MEFYEESQKEIIRDAITNAFLRYEQTHGESISYQQFDAEMLFALHLFNAPEYGNCYLYLSWDEACVMIDDAVNHKSKFSSYPYSKHLPKDADEFYFKSKAEFVNSMENLYYMLSSTKRKPESLKRIAENVLVSYRLTDRDFNILMAEFTFNESGHYDYRSLLPEGFDDKALSTLMDEKQKKVQYYKDSFFYLDITLEQRWDIRYSIGSKISKLLRPKSECFSLDEFKNIIWDGVFNPDNNENSGPLTWTEIKVMIADAFFNSDLTEGQVDYDMTYPPEEGNKFLLSIASEDLQSMCDLYEKLKTWGNGKKLSTEELKKRATDTSLSTADQLTKTDINSLIFQLGKPGRPFEYKDFLPKEADIAFFKDLLQAKDKPTVQPPAGQQVQTPDIIYNWDEQDGRLTAVATGKGKIKISIDSKQREDKDFVYISITSKPGNKHKITAFYTKSPGVKAENEVVIPTKQKQSYKKNPPEITPNYKDGTLAVSAHADLGVWLMVINKKDPDDYQVAIGEHKAALTFSYNDSILNLFEAKAYVLEQGAQCSDFARKSITINAKETTFKKEPPKIKWEEKNGKMTVSANSGADKNLFVWIKVKLNGAEFRDNEKVLKQKVSLNIPYNQHIKNTFEATARFLDKSHKPVSNDACETRVIEAKEQKPTYDKKAPIIEKADAKDGVLTVTATGDYGVYLKVNNKKDKKDLKEDEKSGKVTVQLSYDPTVNNTFEITTYSTEQGKRVSQYVNQEIPVAASIPEPPVELPDKPLIEEDHKNGEVTVTATGKGIVRLKIGNKIEEGKGTAIQNVSYNPKKGITITAEAWIMLEGQPVSPATKVFQIDAKTSEPPAVTTPDKPLIDGVPENGKLTVTAKGNGIVRLVVGNKKKSKKDEVFLNIDYDEKVDNTFTAEADIMYKGKSVGHADKIFTIAAIIPDKPDIKEDYRAFGGTGVLTVTAKGEGQVKLEVGELVDQKKNEVSLRITYDPEIDNDFKAVAYIMHKGMALCNAEKNITIPADIPEPTVIPDKPVIKETYENGVLTVTATGDGLVKLEVGELVDQKKNEVSLSIPYEPFVDNNFKAVASIMYKEKVLCTEEKDITIAAIIPDKPVIKETYENGVLTVTATGDGLVKLEVGELVDQKKNEVSLSIPYEPFVDNNFKAVASIMYKEKALCTEEKDITIAAIIPDKPVIKETYENGVLTVTATGKGQVKLEVGEFVDQKENEVSLSIPYEPFVDNNFKAVADIMYKGKSLCHDEKKITIAAIIPDKPVIKETYENGVLTVTATGDGLVKLEVGEFVDQKKNEVSLSIPYEPFVDNNFKAVASIMYNGEPLCTAEKDITIAAKMPDKPVITETHEDGVLTVTASGEGEVKLEIGNQSNQHKDSASLKISYEVRKSNTFMARAFIMHNGKPLCMAEKEIFIEAVLPDPPEITWNASNGVLTVIATGEGIVRLDVDNLQYEEKDRAYLFFAYKTDRENVFHAQACIIENGSRMSHYAQTVITIPAQEQKPGGNNGNTTGDGGSGDDGSNGGGSGSGGTNDGGNKLASLDFRYIIGGPLKACVEAQEESARATTNYMTSAMLEKDENDIADYKPVMMYFYFIKDGSYNELSIPLMSILPIPYMNINHVDLNFQAQVTFSDKGQTNDKYELKACYPTYTAEDKRDTTTLTETTARQNINIKLRASSIDQPAGISRLIQILDQEMSEIAPVTTRTVIEALPGNSFGVLLMSAGAHPVPVIEKLRELLNIGLPDAKALVDRAPVTIKDGITEDSAEAIKASLFALGAEVELVGKELITGGEPGGNGEVPGGNGEVPGGNGEVPDGNGEVPEGNGEVSGGNGEESGGNKGETGDNLVDPHYNDAVIIFDVVLKKPGTKKTQVIKKVKELLSIGLKDAKELVNKAPSTIMTGATKDAAEALKAALVALGAEVELIGHKPTTDEPQPSIDDLQPPVDELQPPVDEPQPPVNDDGNANDDNTKYDVVLKSSGAKKLEVIKIIKERLKVGLKDAKDWVDHAPHTIMTGAAKGVAEALKAELVALGAEVELKGQKPTAEDNTATAFDVILKTSGIQKLEVIKKVKEQLKIGLKDAKELMDRLPYAIATGVAKDVAEALKAELVALGAEVELIGQKPTAQEGPSGNRNSTKTIVDIFIKSPGAQKLAVIKKIKESLTIGLKDAKDRVDNAPATIMTGVARDVAEALKAELVALGADVELR